MLELTQTGAGPALRKPHFADGHLLRAEDLLIEQEANQLRQRWLGAAIGTGVMEGLEVNLADRAPDGSIALRVSAGRAIAPAGQMLSVPDDVRLVVRPQAGPARGNGAFTPRPAVLDAPPFEAKVFLLVAQPALERDGLTYQVDPVAGRQLGRRPHQFWVETVRFRLVELTLGDEAHDPDTVRNRLAFRCFGIARPEAVLQPGAPSAEGIYSLAPQGALTDGDLPLALIGWGPEGLLFLDQWAVRRRLHARPAMPWPLSGLVQAGPVSEAMVLQFQAQLEEMRAAGDCREVVAAQYFRYLPPVGWIPTDAFAWDSFLRGFDVHLLEGGAEALPIWLMEAQYRPPVDLNHPVPLALYRPKEGGYGIFLRADDPNLREQTIDTTVGASVLVELDLPRGAALVPEQIRVFACDEWGKAYQGILTGRRFAIFSLPPGPYSVWVAMDGCRPVCQRIRHEEGKTEVVVLVPRPPVPVIEAGVEPGVKSSEVEFQAAAPFKGFLQVDPDPLSIGEIPAHARSWTWYDAGACGLDGWLGRWAVWLTGERPDLPVDPHNLRLLLGPEITVTASAAAGPALKLIHTDLRSVLTGGAAVLSSAASTVGGVLGSDLSRVATRAGSAARLSDSVAALAGTVQKVAAKTPGDEAAKAAVSEQAATTAEPHLTFPPNAYVVFGDGGVYMPALLVSTAAPAPKEDGLVDPTKVNYLRVIIPDDLAGAGQGRQGWFAKAWESIKGFLGF